MSNIEKSMFETLKCDLSGIGKDIAEVGVDSWLKDGLLKDIPIVNIITSVYKTGMNLRDRFFFKKILIFLNSLNETSTEERITFFEKHHCEDSNFGEKLLILLDRLDDIHKPQLIANLFKNYLNEDITLINFQRLSQIIDRCFIEDLRYLKVNEDKEVITGFEALGLANNGLATIASLDGGSFNEVDFDPENDYKINKLGRILIKYALDGVL